MSEDERRLLEAALADPVCAAVVARLPALGLPDSWLVAGALFQNVWNSIEGRPPGWGIKDYDVFYFDDTDLSWEAEDRVITAAEAAFGDLEATIEVRNQARVHLWYEARFGVMAPPYTSSRDAIASFAATTCCVGITAAVGELVVHAPYGLDGTLAMRMVPNPRLAPRRVYEDKVRSYAARWPSLVALPWPPGNPPRGI